MRTGTLTGAGLAALLLGIGVLAGSVMGTTRLAAQTPGATATSTPQAATTPAATAIPRAEGFPKVGGPGRMGHHGPGVGGRHGGPGLGPHGATADGATASISGASTLIDLVKADLAFANGKMDTTDVQRWVSGAEGLLGNARSANSGSQYGQASTYAHAARELALVAYAQIAQELGADTLPSAGQFPWRGHMGMGVPANATITQSQASHLLAHTYEHLIMVGAVIDRAQNAGQAASYLTDAQDAYRDAYNAYQAGNYAEAVQAAKLSGELARVAGILHGAPNAPANQDTPVTVPAPNF